MEDHENRGSVPIEAPSYEVHQGDRLGKHVIDFLDWASNEGYMNPSTTTSISTGYRRVMEMVFGEDWLSIDLRDIDVEHALDVVGKKGARTLNEQTLATYKHRFGRAVKEFMDYADAPYQWINDHRSGVDSASPDDIVSYRMPLRGGTTHVEVRYPKDIARDEIERVRQFVDIIMAP